jgi:hypothetical protein
MTTFYETTESAIETDAAFVVNLEKTLERASAPVWARMGREMASRIELLAPYLEPCYRVSESASFPSVSAVLDTPDESGQRIHRGLSTVSGWFYRWRDRLARLPEKPRKRDMVGLVDELDRVLIFTSLFGTALAERAMTQAFDGPDRKRFRMVASRYDRFLTDYERVWRASESRSHAFHEWPTLPREPYYERIGTFGASQPASLAFVPRS